MREASTEREPEREPAQRPLAERILDLQHTAGNAAVSRLVAARPVLARYESGEHAQFGGARKVTINTVEFDEGEVIALGDMYETPEEMQKADPAELLNLRALIRRDKEHFEGKAGVKAVGNPEWSTATAGRPANKQFMEMAKRNEAHFAPRKMTTGAPNTDNKSKWEELHGRALLKVVEHVAGGGKGVPEEATTLNAFAAHFLTDAFSAGHMIHKDDVMSKAKDMWGKQKETSGLIFGESKFTKGVARKVLGDAGVKAKLAGKQLKLAAWGEITEERFSELIWQMEKKKPAEFFQAFARVVHDELNRSVKDPAHAIEVTNGKDTWTLAGDETLSFSPKTLEVARAAVDQSYDNLQAVAAKSESPDVTEYYGRVWAYVPHTTKTGEERMKKVVDSLTDANTDESIDAFAALAIEQIDTAIAELTAQGYMRDKPKEKVESERPERLPIEPKY